MVFDETEDEWAIAIILYYYGLSLLCEPWPTIDIALVLGAPVSPQSKIALTIMSFSQASRWNSKIFC